MGAGSRVVIIGAASHWGSELARPWSATRASPIWPRSTPSPRRRPGADRVHRGRHPQPGDLADPPGSRAGGGRPLRHRLVSGARQAGAGASRHQRDRHPAAARRLREGPRVAGDRRPRLGGDLRLRGLGALLLHRGDGAPLSAEDPLPARHRRARGLLRQLRPPPARGDLHDAPLPAGDRPGTRAAAQPLPLAAGGPDPARLRPPAAADPRRGRHRGVGRGGPQPGPRPGQRRPRRDDLAQPDRCASPAAPRCRSPISFAGVVLGRRAETSAPQISTTTGSGCCDTAAAATTPG